MQRDERPDYLHLNVVQFVFRARHFWVLLASDMGHVTPVVRSIRYAGRQCRAIEGESMSSRAVDDLAQIVDPSLVRRMPRKISGAVLRGHSGEPQRG